MLLVDIFLTFSFFLSGITNEAWNIASISAITTIFLGFIYCIKNKIKIEAPPHMIWMLVFIFVLQISLFLSGNPINSFHFLITFLEGVAFWVLFFNFKNSSKHAYFIILTITLIYSSFYLFTKYEVLNFSRFFELFYNFTPGPSHQHLGDLWAITLLIFIWKFLQEKNITPKIRLFLLGFLIATGFYFLFISFSRTSFLSLLGGIGFLFIKRGVVSQKVFMSVSLLTILFITITGIDKSLLFSRPYFLQSFVGLFHFPFGVGVNNFSVVSNFISQKYQFLFAPSQYALNIFLETLSGLGILAFPFFTWFILTVKEIWRGKRSLWSAVFVAISISFFFDYTYTIPGFFWLWFISLGIAQSENLKKSSGASM